ncbi:HIT domain-containing protein [Corynebacterium sp. sy039]|uniref:HIT family protein n=1 Tax=Corynebacterium sp. sy039 TaxID=2599641 RepID=UPI0011B4E930|nr:HIT domain-containing protein [Corynebacterium sp. sy039]QDZ42707.1 HIT domain-containing protein [Corynebacterium sp. sy039]
MEHNHNTEYQYRATHTSADNSIPDIGVAAGEDKLQRLWAPYRMSYIHTNDNADNADAVTPKKNNPFVDIPKMSDEEGLIVARGKFVYCLLNLYPYNSGHMMVVPYREVAELENLSEEETAELMRFAKKAIVVLKTVSQPDAVNAGFNLGKAAGGSVAQHLHMHIVPRWTGDANFMTIISHTKVLPQLLHDTRELLADAWRKLGEDNSTAAQNNMCDITKGGENA